MRIFYVVSARGVPRIALRAIPCLLTLAARQSMLREQLLLPGCLRSFAAMPTALPWRQQLRITHSQVECTMYMRGCF